MLDDAPATTLFQHIVDESENGERVDAVLALLLDGYSRVFIRKVVHEGGARVEGERVKPSFRVRAGQQIEVDLPPPPDDGPRPDIGALRFAVGGQ